MDPTIQLFLAVTIAALVVAGGLIAALRLIPRPEVPDSLRAIRTELSDLQAQFLDFADRYELSVQRNVAKVGKLRRKLQMAEDGDDPDDADGPPAELPALPAVTEAPTKSDLWLAYNRKVAS